MKRNFIKTIAKVTGVLFVCTMFASFSPSLDGRAVVADEGVFPEGLFAKTVGYLPGDELSVTNISGNTTVEILVIGALDPSEGVAILLSPEAAEAIGIEKNSNNIVKITKRTGQDERCFGTAVIAKASEADKIEEAEVPEEAAEEESAEPEAEESSEAEEEFIPADEESDEELAGEESEEPFEDEGEEDEYEEELLPEAEESDESDEEEYLDDEEPLYEDDESEEEYLDDEEPFAETEYESEEEYLDDEEEPFDEETADDEEFSYEDEAEEEEFEEEPLGYEEKNTSEYFEADELGELAEPEEESEYEEDFDDEEEEDIFGPIDFSDDGYEEYEESEDEEFESDEEEYDAIVLVPADSNPPEVENVVSVEDYNYDETSSDDEVEDVTEVDAAYNEAIELEQEAAPSEGGFDKYIVKSFDDLQKGAYYIQIAVLRDEANINDVISKYGKNYPIVIIPKADGNGNYILIGPLNVDEYGAVLARFKAYGYKDAFLRKIK